MKRNVLLLLFLAAVLVSSVTAKDEEKSVNGKKSEKSIEKAAANSTRPEAPQNNEDALKREAKDPVLRRALTG